MRKKKILLFGVGWLGKELLESFLDENQDVYVATRDVHKWVSFESKLKLVEMLDSVFLLLLHFNVS